MTPEDLTVARALADKLIETAEPSKYWDDLDALTIGQCRALDSIAFECTVCNQWFAVSEMVEDTWICKGCQE